MSGRCEEMLNSWGDPSAQENVSMVMAAVMATEAAAVTAVAAVMAAVAATVSAATTVTGAAVAAVAAV